MLVFCSLYQDGKMHCLWLTPSSETVSFSGPSRPSERATKNPMAINRRLNIMGISIGQHSSKSVETWIQILVSWRWLKSGWSSECFCRWMLDWILPWLARLFYFLMFCSSPESFHLTLVVQCVLPRILRSGATTPLKRSPAAWRVAMNTGSSKNVEINSLASPQLFDPIGNPTIYLAISKTCIFFSLCGRVSLKDVFRKND